MTPAERGGLRRRLRRAIAARGGVEAVAAQLQLPAGAIDSIVSPSCRPREGMIAALAYLLLGTYWEPVYLVPAPTCWWLAPGGAA